MQCTEILIVPETNNAVDVVEERIFQGTPLFNVKTQQFERLILYYHRITNELEMRKSPQAFLLQHIRRRSIHQAIMDRFQDGISYFALG